MGSLQAGINGILSTVRFTSVLDRDVEPPKSDQASTQTKNDNSTSRYDERCTTYTREGGWRRAAIIHGRFVPRCAGAAAALGILGAIGLGIQ